MSTKNARRHQTLHGEVTDLAERRTSRAATLVAIRDRLAESIAERESHDLPVTDLLGDLLDLEAAIRTISPQLYADRWLRWVQRDAELAHTPELPLPGCTLCLLLQADVGTGEFNIAENIRLVTPNTERYDGIYGWREEEEARNNNRDESKHNRQARARSVKRSHENEIGAAIVRNGLAARLHRERTAQAASS